MSLCKLYLERYAPVTGYYIEIGAYNGKTQNSTIILEKRGWQGVCVEAHPVNYKKLKKNRKCTCIHGAVYSKSGFVTIVDVGTPGWSGIKDTHQDKHKQRYSNDSKEYTVPSFTFDQIAEKNIIDYLQIDVEGAELEIINSINWNNYYIKHLCIEDNLRIEKNDDTYFNILKTLGFKLIAQDNKDFLYENIN